MKINLCIEKLTLELPAIAMGILHVDNVWGHQGAQDNALLLSLLVEPILVGVVDVCKVVGQHFHLFPRIVLLVLDLFVYNNNKKKKKLGTQSIIRKI